MVYEQRHFVELEASPGNIVKSRRLYPPDGLWVDVVLKWTVELDPRVGGSDDYITKTRLVVPYVWSEVRARGDVLFSIDAKDYVYKTWSLLAKEVKKGRNYQIQVVSVEYVHRDGTPYDTRQLDLDMVMAKLTARK